MRTLHANVLGWISWIVLLILPLTVLAQQITLAEISASNDRSSWRLIFTSPDIVHYQCSILTKPTARLLIEFSPANQLNYQISPFMLTSTPLANMRSGAVGQNRLRVLFDLRQSMTFSSQVIAGVPNKLIITLNELKKPVVRTVPPVKLPTVTPATLATSATVAAKLPEIHTISTPTAQLRRIIIVIDPGHGGKDPGATGIHGIHEKDVVLNISKKLQAMINSQPGFHAVLTRNSDYFIPLRQRLTIARQDKADMFVAIHADAYMNPYSHGASVFALSSRGATSEAARWLAQRENQSELMGGVDLADKENVLRSVLLNLSQTATIHASLLIGQNLLQGLRQFAPLHYSKVEQAAFVVLKSPDIPSLLVETGFVSNTADAQHLNNYVYQEKIAQALMLGITRYFMLNPPPDTWLAEQRYPTYSQTNQYRVQSGDTLSAIAQKLGVSMASLRAKNHLTGDVIYSGQLLKTSG